MNEDFEVKTWSNVVVQTDVKAFIDLRKKYGIQQEVVDMLELSDKQLISKYESLDSGIDDRVYSLFLLICNEHPYYKLLHRSQDTNEEHTIKSGDYKDVLVLEDYNGKDIKRIRLLTQLYQDDFGKLWGKATKSDVSKIENDKYRISSRAWTVLLLVTNQHPYFYLAPR